MPSDISGASHEGHALTHHGFRPEAVAELVKIERAMFLLLNDLLSGLRAARECGASLLYRTMVLYGSAWATRIRTRT